MQKNWVLAVLLLFHLFLLVNLRFEAWPEMVLYPWLLSKGFLLYRDIINPYLPFLTWLLFLFSKISGFTILNLKLLTWIFILLTDLLVFYISLKFWKSQKVALYSLAFFIFWQPFLDGNSLWFDLTTTPFLLLTFHFFSFFLSKKAPSKNLFLASLFLAVAFFIKQTTLWFYLLLFLYLLLQKDKKLELRFREGFLLIFPLIVFLLFTGFYFYNQKIFNDFLFWSLKFPFLVLPKMPGHKQLPNLRQLALTLIPFLSLILFSRIKLKKEKKFVFVFLWFLVAFLFIFPRWGLFHLQPALAFFSILTGKSLFSLFKRSFQKIELGAMLAILFLSLLFQGWFLKKYWHKETRFFENQILAQALWLRKNTDAGQVIFNLNGPDQLYFLADREPLKPWVANFPWYYEGSDLKERVLFSLKENQPEVIIYSKALTGDKFSPGVYQPEEIKKWILAKYQPYFEIGDTQFLKKKGLDKTTVLELKFTGSLPY